MRVKCIFSVYPNKSSFYSFYQYNISKIIYFKETRRCLMIVLASWLHNESANIISGMSIFIIFLLFVVKVQIFDLEVYIYA